MMQHQACFKRTLFVGLTGPIALIASIGCDPGLGVPEGNRPPQADARVMGMVGQNAVVDYAGVPLQVTLDASFSKDPDGSIQKYRWLSGKLRPGLSVAAGSGGATAGRGAAAGGGAAGTGAAGTGAAGMAAAGMGAAGMGAAGMAMADDSDGGTAGQAGAAAGRSGGTAGGAAGMSAAGTGAAGMAAAGAGGERRMVPAGARDDWPDDVMQPVVTLSEGEYVFELWVEDNKGIISTPSTLKVTVRTPLDAATQECVNKVYPATAAACKACVCGVNDMCKTTLTSMSVCDATCWGFLSCIASKCPDFVPGGPTGCLVNNCSATLGGATGATMIAPCITPCTAQCRSM